PPARVPTSHHISAVMSNASSEINRLRDLPASSYKWTWGETLSKDEVLDLRRPGIQPGVAHSGYQVSLREGRLGGEYSADEPTSLSLIGQHENLPADVSFIPPLTDLALPNFFSKPDQRTYDPLHLSNASIPTSLPNPPPLSIAVTVANDWTSSTRSRSMSGSSESIPGTAAVLKLADDWSSVSGSKSGSESHRALEDHPMPVDGTGINLNRVPGLDSGTTYMSGSPGSIPGMAAVISLADNWSSGPGSESGKDGNPASEDHHLPVDWTSGINENEVPGLDSNFNLSLADNWTDDDTPEHPGNGLDDPAQLLLL